jgi:hypothetical protein
VSRRLIPVRRRNLRPDGVGCFAGFGSSASSSLRCGGPTMVLSSDRVAQPRGRARVLYWRPRISKPGRLAMTFQAQHAGYDRQLKREIIGSADAARNERFARAKEC